MKLGCWLSLLLLSMPLLAKELTSIQSADALLRLYHYPNMPKSVSIFKSKSRTFLGKIEISSEAELRCHQTEKATRNGNPYLRELTLEGKHLIFSLERYVDHELNCQLKDDQLPEQVFEIKANYYAEMLPEEEDDIRAQNNLHDWLDKTHKQQELLRLDMPPELCQENIKSPSYKVATGFIYRMTQGGEACTSPIRFANGNILNFCNKNIPSGEFAMEARVFSSGLKTLGKTIILDLEVDTLRPKFLKTQQHKEIVILHSLSGKVAGLDSLGKKIFDVTLPLSWITEPTIYQDRIYTISQEDRGIKNSLYILDTQGEIINEVTLPGSSFASPQVQNNSIIVGNERAELMILSLQGEIQHRLQLADKLRYPGGAITHLFSDVEDKVYLTTNKGELLSLNLNSLQVDSLYLAPNDGKKVKMGASSRDREVLSRPIILKNQLIALATDSRIHFVDKAGALIKIVETGNVFSLQSPLTAFDFQGEELIWVGSMGQIYILDSLGIKKMEYSPYETHKSESMAENYSSPLVLTDGRILAGVYMGLRYFKLSTGQAQLNTHTSQTCQ